MPESFDILLSEIAETAGSTVHPSGAELARRRGHQLAVRRRVVASVMSVVLVCGVGGLAFGLTSGHSGAPAPVTHSVTPTLAAPSAPASPSASSSSSSSPSATASASAPTSTAITGDLNTIVPGAWTPVSKFPYSWLKWKANPNQPSIYTSDRQWFYSCGSGMLAHLGASGYQELSYTSTYSGTQSADSADQVLFFFPSTSAAEQALATVRNDYAHCPERTVGVNGVAITGTVQQTEELDGSYAWLHTYKTANGSPAVPADIAANNHEFFVQRGDVLEMVSFVSDTSITYQSGDLQFLNDLNAGLCVYGRKCPASATPLTAGVVSSSGSTSLALGGSWLEVGVTVTNNSNDTIRNISPIVSLGHCTCSNTPVSAIPNGTLQVMSPTSNSWQTVFYDAEGTGMDYLLSPSALQVPAFDLPAGESVKFDYRVQLKPASQQPKLTGPYRLTNGSSSIDVTLVHPTTGNEQIGTSPTASLPVTVTVS